MKLWLKVSCILLVFYSVIFSFSQKLSPGIIGVDRQSLSNDNARFTIYGYNTHFAKAGNSLHVLLEIDSIQRICAEVVSVPSEDQVVVETIIPPILRGPVASVYVNNDIDGTVYFPNALSLKDAEINKSFIPQTLCSMDVKTEESAFRGYPFQPTIFETIRNLMFHVPMWFTMFFLMILSFVNSLVFLRTGNFQADARAHISTIAGLVFCILGLITGSIWARFAWGAWWVKDPQLNGALVVFLIYAAYLVLRRSVSDEEKRGRLSAIYNIFAFVMMIILLMVLPRMPQTYSLHPGKSGTPAFSSYDLDQSLRMVFYPAVVGWILLGYWIYTVRLRIFRIQEKMHDL